MGVAPEYLGHLVHVDGAQEVVGGAALGGHRGRGEPSRHWARSPNLHHIIRKVTGEGERGDFVFVFVCLFVCYIRAPKTITLPHGNTLKNHSFSLIELEPRREKKEEKNAGSSQGLL